MVSYRIAQKGEAHTIAETFIKPYVIDIVTCMLDDKSAKHLSIIPLSNNTVTRQIEDLVTYQKHLSLVLNTQNLHYKWTNQLLLLVLLCYWCSFVT